MATKGDDPKKKKADRNLVSLQKHEVDYLAKKTKQTKEAVEKAIKAAGPSRKSVVKKLGK